MRWAPMASSMRALALAMLVWICPTSGENWRQAIFILRGGSDGPGSIGSVFSRAQRRNRGPLEKAGNWENSNVREQSIDLERLCL